MSKIKFQCLEADCLKVFDERIDVCPSCGGQEINELLPMKCDQCGYEDEDVETRTIYFSPYGYFCETCVPRDPCSCNTFDTKEEGLHFCSEKRLKQTEDGRWIATDEQGRLCPCVDYN